MEIPKKIKDDIWEYCRINDISNIDEFIVKLIKQGFISEKYGSTPIGSPQIVEIEKIVEVTVDVIKEVIVEKEVIKEVPVEKIVTKIEYISDKQNENELFGKIEQLEENIFQLNEQIVLESKIFSTKTKETAKIFQQEINKKNKEIKNLSSSLEKIKGDSLKKNMEVGELKKSIEGVNKDINNKPDIYGEDSKGGWFGSNLLKK